MNKHDANIKKGKLINFQIAVIAVISFCYFMYEMNTYSLPAKKTIAAIDNTEVYNTMGPVEVYVEPEVEVIPEKVKPIKKIEKTVINKGVKPKVVDNKTKITETKATKKTTITSTKTTQKTITAKPATKSKPAITINKPFTIKSVDVLPIFPGCDKYSTNSERATCFQEKVQRLITKKFNKNIGNDLDTKGTQRISLYFEIDTNGEITNINARSTHSEFIEEAKRVAKKLPKMEPARSGNRNVKMAYNVPIIFRVEN